MNVNEQQNVNYECKIKVIILIKFNQMFTLNKQFNINLVTYIVINIKSIIGSIFLIVVLVVIGTRSCVFRLCFIENEGVAALARTRMRRPHWSRRRLVVLVTRVDLGAPRVRIRMVRPARSGSLTDLWNTGCV